MITLLSQGDYQLIEIKNLSRILKISDKGTFAWINAKGIGEILNLTHKKQKAEYVLSVGKYRIYDVKDDPKLTDTLHLELSTGKGSWQGYLLITGLPTDKNKRSRIIPTKEIITKSSNFSQISNNSSSSL